MQLGQPAIWLFKLLSIGFAYTGSIGDWDACGGRLERALDALRRDSIRRNKLDEEEAGTLYQRELHSAPLEMSVSRMAVKLPEGAKGPPGGQWARVEQCVYDPGRSFLRTRVVFNDLSVSGTVSLTPRDRRGPITAESCRMTLRLRRAGIDFLTGPIARGHGQMRIRTESSFLEPRFASIYAYGCRATRIDKQIKRQDRWPPYHSASIIKVTTPPLPLSDKYDVAEPRQLAGNAEEMDIVIPNESRHSRHSHAAPDPANRGVWRKNSWITKSSPRRRRSGVTPRLGLEGDAPTNGECKSGTEGPAENSTKILDPVDGFQNEEDQSQNAPREVRELVANDNLFPVDSEDSNRSWQSKEYIMREMEDVFLQGASQALTRYIERQLHPAIKETLMLSMGYTISYG